MSKPSPPGSPPFPSLRGRCVSVAPLVLATEAGLREVAADPGTARPGDLIAVEGGRARVVAAASAGAAGPGHAGAPGPRHIERVLHPRRLRAMAVREAMEREIRAFFHGRGFRETRTPALVPAPGTEPHIRPFATAGGAGWLHTSPELAMKRLLVGGLERIFQLCPVFRDEPASPAHRREFTMLEWYRAWSGWEDIQRDTEELFAHLAIRAHGAPRVPAGDGVVDLAPPWPRLWLRDLYREHAGVDLAGGDLRAACAARGIAVANDDSWDDLFFRLWLAAIEPRLPRDRGVFVCGYPESQAALAVLDQAPDGWRFARRFEVYAGGLELGNAFEELTDPVEQRRRFQADEALRRQRYGYSVPLPEAFLGALDEGMPPAGGIALGVERMAMLLGDEPDIEYVTWGL
jgi:elongation factor P--(R)-beta-lysine ligase